MATKLTQTRGEGERARAELKCALFLLLLTPSSLLLLFNFYSLLSRGNTLPINQLHKKPKSFFLSFRFLLFLLCRQPKGEQWLCVCVCVYVYSRRIKWRTLARKKKIHFISRQEIINFFLLFSLCICLHCCCALLLIICFCFYLFVLFNKRRKLFKYLKPHLVLIGVDGWNATAPIDCRKRNEQSSERTNECQLTAISSAAAGVDVDVVIAASQCWAQLLLLPARSHRGNACACVRQGAHETPHSWVANFCDHIWSCFKANRWLRAANVASSPLSLSHASASAVGTETEDRDVSGCGNSDTMCALKVFSIFARLIKKTGIFAFKKQTK